MNRLDHLQDEYYINNAKGAMRGVDDTLDTYNDLRKHGRIDEMIKVTLESIFQTFARLFNGFNKGEFNLEDGTYFRVDTKKDKDDLKKYYGDNLFD